MDVVFSANNRKETLKLPIVPEGLEWPQPMNNETFDTINVEVNLIGLKGLITLSISSFFPMKPYPFAKSKVMGKEGKAFFEKWMKKRESIRAVITSDSGLELLNIPVTIENFTPGIDKAGDITYTLDLKEFKPLVVK